MALYDLSYHRSNWKCGGAGRQAAYRSRRRPRVFVREPQKALARDQDHVEIFVGDLENPKTLQPALEGTDALLLVTAGSTLAAQDKTAAKAAMDAGVARLVKLSS